MGIFKWQWIHQKRVRLHNIKHPLENKGEQSQVPRLKRSNWIRLHYVFIIYGKRKSKIEMKNYNTSADPVANQVDKVSKHCLQFNQFIMNTIKMKQKIQ